MKYLLILLFTAVLLTGCGGENENKPADDKNKFAFDSTDVKTTEADNPTEAFRLAYKFEKGKKYNYRLTTIAKDDQTIHMDTTISQNVSQNIVYLFSLSTVDVDNEGVMEMECNVGSIKVEAKSNTQSFSYESGKADSANKVKFFDYEMFINNPFRFRISPKGEVVEVFRVDRILNKMLELKNFADSVTAEQKNLIRRDISEGAIKQLLGQVIREVPEKQVAKDSSWTKQQPESRFLIYTTRNVNTYQIENLEMLGDDKIAVINAGLQANLTGENNFTDRGISYKFTRPTTDAAGKIFFNISDGLIQKARTRTQINIAYSMEGPTPQGIQKRSQEEVIENINILELL